MELIGNIPDSKLYEEIQYCSHEASRTVAQELYWQTWVFILTRQGHLGGWAASQQEEDLEIDLLEWGIKFGEHQTREAHAVKGNLAEQGHYGDGRSQNHSPYPSGLEYLSLVYNPSGYSLWLIRKALSFSLFLKKHQPCSWDNSKWTYNLYRPYCFFIHVLNNSYITFSGCMAEHVVWTLHVARETWFFSWCASFAKHWLINFLELNELVWFVKFVMW